MEDQIRKITDEFLNLNDTKMDACHECGYHSIIKIEDAVEYGFNKCLEYLLNELKPDENDQLRKHIGAIKNDGYR